MKIKSEYGPEGPYSLEVAIGLLFKHQNVKAEI